MSLLSKLISAFQTIGDHIGRIGSITFTSRAIAQAATVDDWVRRIAVYHGGVWCQYKRDASGTALSTNGGTLKWSPDGHHTQYHYGAVGDYSTDDSTALQRWLDSFDGTPLWSAGGVFRCLDHRLELPKGIQINGVGGPRIACYPQYSAEKEKIRPGYKGSLSGSVIIFDGTPAEAAFDTARTDGRTDLNPMLLYNHQQSCQVSGFDIIQDMDILDADGDPTTATTDNRSSGFDCGFVNLGSACRINIGVFGYLPQGGMVHVAKVGDDISDPDYSDLSGSTINSGVVILGASGATPDGGNTGFKGTGVQIYGSDHHNRDDADPDVPTLYVDGDTGGSNSGIRGASFTASNFRTYANEAMVFGNCDDISLIGCTTEFSNRPISGLDVDGKIIGTAETGNVTFIGLAATQNLGIDEFINAIGGKFFISQSGLLDGTIAGTGGGGGTATGTRFGASGLTGDPYFQLTADLSSANTGWLFLMDRSDGDEIDIRWNGSTKMTLSTDGTLTVNRVAARPQMVKEDCTLSSNEITVSDGTGWVSVDNGGAAGTLNTINGNFEEGDKLILTGKVLADVITLADLTGNIRCEGSADITINGAQDWIELFFDGDRFRTTPLRDVS